MTKIIVDDAGMPIGKVERLENGLFRIYRFYPNHKRAETDVVTYEQTFDPTLPHFDRLTKRLKSERTIDLDLIRAVFEGKIRSEE